MATAIEIIDIIIRVVSAGATVTIAAQAWRAARWGWLEIRPITHYSPVEGVKGKYHRNCIHVRWDDRIDENWAPLGEARIYYKGPVRFKKGDYLLTNGHSKKAGPHEFDEEDEVWRIIVADCTRVKAVWPGLYKQVNEQ